MPRTLALVTLDIDGYRVSEIAANEGDTVAAGQPVARLTRQSGDVPGAPPGPASITLRAPAAGLITRSTAKIGATAHPRAEPLFQIAVDKEIELDAEVSSIHVPKLAAGQTARIEVEDGRELTARVRLAPASIDTRTQLGRVRLSMDSDPSLRVGRFARATIDAVRSCGVAVPRSAVLHRTEGTSVQVVRDRVVETRRVRAGLQSETEVEIREGIRVGDLIVANAGTSLRDGDQVRPIFADGSTVTGER